MTQIMFETFNVPAFYVMNQSQSALYSQGKTNGIVLDFGYQTTYSIPIYEGNIISEHVNFTDVGGDTVTKYSEHIWKKAGFSEVFDKFKGKGDPFDKRNKYDAYTIREKVKTQMLYVAGADWKDPLEIRAEKLVNGYLRYGTTSTVVNIPKDVINVCYKYYDGVIYELPDGNEIIMSSYDRTQGIECLFDPGLMKDIDNKIAGEVGIDDILNKTIIGCKKEEDKELLRKVCENVVIFGSTAMFDGMEYRIQKGVDKSDVDLDAEAVKKIMDESNDRDVAVKVNVIAPDTKERQYGAWIGGSIVTSLPTFKEMWISYDEYDENGPSVVHKKCV